MDDFPDFSVVFDVLFVESIDSIVINNTELRFEFITTVIDNK